MYSCLSVSIALVAVPIIRCVSVHYNAFSVTNGFPKRPACLLCVVCQDAHCPVLCIDGVMLRRVRLEGTVQSLLKLSPLQLLWKFTRNLMSLTPFKTCKQKLCSIVQNEIVLTS
jgi:hypothetical protein